MKTLGILSNKGGVGKTSIAVNIAVQLAKEGKNVCLLDNDFSGPSLMTFFPPNVKWINSFMAGDEKLNDYLQEIDSISFDLKGKLYVCFANPTHESIRDHLSFDRKKYMKMFQNLVKMKRDLRLDPFNVDYFIIDSSPGAGFSTINVALVSDVNLFIVKISNADLYGTTEMISGIYENLKSKCLILANHIPPNFINDASKMKMLEGIIEKKFISQKMENGMEFLGWIPADLDLFTYEFDDAVASFRNEANKRKIFSHDHPDHIFSKTLRNLIPRMFGE
jgi:cellulose biosynthesis protein BcsQ